MNEDGMLVSREWLERVDAALFGTSRADADGKRVASLFYDVRPARLESAWTQNVAGLWTATASFIVNDAADSSFVFPVYAPTATADPRGEVQTTRFFVIWRGRWELVASAGGDMDGDAILDKLTITSALTVVDITPSTKTINSATGSVSGSVTATGNVSLSLNEDIPANPGVAVVVDILATAQGALGVETKKISATFTGTAATFTATAATTSETVVESVGKTRAARVATIAAKE